MTSSDTVVSVFDDVLAQFPGLEVHQFHKSTLLGLSWAIEDEFCARADRPVLVAAFQKAEFWERSRERWTSLAKISHQTLVIADFEDLGAEPDVNLTTVPVAPGSPMSREWIVVCDATDLPAALIARELPGQSTVPDRKREFEAFWTTELDVVRAASRASAQIAAAAGAPVAAPLLYHLAEQPVSGSVSASAVSRLFNRIVVYLDRATTGPLPLPSMA
ncbi:DICT sensory domain-containing protein [Auraticoccus monumenti]|uniref:DICT domain-containing protein n=1 Tax=Auraticoccus monumenti TaxID=675864 RepID=A0A1G6Y5E0_9ACTN|nr:DICT sensory domain-containing protein [Auraticoccus monumenti]SDD85193.1 DICT domain-containing protein [Auraticoccus monumenti]